ncbi:IclR family transcriptional regulator domain-containing protein [Flavisphingomonas formosensis]|uniref:IclR family transcriptional regulator domain-containing protein n=1 Tax=Flavisphingomonas formosensis TaxID=861534 RepID=UPI0012FCD5D9|nr:IclR family transcriptional regulator C-terminal domain-containing protein [Sphingomonas formosensis]
MPALRDEDAAARALNPVGKDFSEALARGLRILRAFNATSRTLSLSDIARLVDLPRATVRRTLLTLIHLGYVEASGRLFSLTPDVLTLAGAYLESSTASSILQPACERLSAEHGETFSMAVMHGSDAVMVAYARPRSMYMLGGGIGLRIPAHCTAVGRVMLSSLAEAARTAFLEEAPIEALTSRTITDRGRLLALMAEIAAQGFAIVEDEAELGFRSLAVPVWRRDGRVGFAINVGMASMSMPMETARERFLPVLRAEADRLGRLLI